MLLSKLKNWHILYATKSRIGVQIVLTNLVEQTAFTIGLMGRQTALVRIGSPLPMPVKKNTKLTLLDCLYAQNTVPLFHSITCEAPNQMFSYTCS